jgi:hypothetical protein
MKLDSHTTEILKNFQGINNSIVIDEGYILKTMSPSETIFARAGIKNFFPKKFGIYDLRQFLGIIALDPDSEIEFHDMHITIKQEKGTIKYSYCSPLLIVSPETDEIELPSQDVVFTLDSDTLKSVMEAMAILGFHEISITGENGKLYLRTLSTRNDNSNEYSTELGECDKTFMAIIESEKLKILPGTYEVAICKEGFTTFKNDKIEYGIALSTTSRF